MLWILLALMIWVLAGAAAVALFRGDVRGRCRRLKLAVVAVALPVVLPVGLALCCVLHPIVWLLEWLKHDDQQGLKIYWPG
jgi:hypothetical protein